MLKEVENGVSTEPEMSKKELFEKTSKLVVDFLNALEVSPDFRESLVHDFIHEDSENRIQPEFKRGNVVWNILYINEFNDKELIIRSDVKGEESVVDNSKSCLRIYLGEDENDLAHRFNITYEQRSIKRAGRVWRGESALKKGNEMLEAFKNTTPQTV
jgi:hypothetical protein